MLLLAALETAENSVGQIQVVRMSAVDHDIGIGGGFLNELQVILRFAAPNKRGEAKFGQGRNAALGAGESDVFVVWELLLERDRYGAWIGRG